MTTPTSRFVRGYLSGLQGFERQIDGWMTDLEDHAAEPSACGVMHPDGVGSWRSVRLWRLKVKWDP